MLFQYDVGDVGEIRLTDIATVRLADNAEELYAKINGNDGVLLTVQKSSIASTSGACDNLYAAMAQLEEKYEGLHLTALSDQGQYIDLVISSVLENLLFGALLAVIVLMLFLRDFRPTIIVALSIPISLLLAVVIMHFTGVTLNIISLSGLALGVGMLVDNSIVAIENIYRLRQLGYNAATAAVHGCRQIAGAITASTLTTVCVFVPILFTSGLTRQIFADMGLTIAYSLGASLLVALTLVPALSGKILTRDTAGEKPNRLLNRMIAGYENLLRKVLRHKAPVLLGAVALLIASAVLAVSMGTAFMPEMDSPQVSVSIEMPEGCSYAIEGENEMIQSTMSDLILMIALAIAFIYLIMVAQFQSLLSPFIVLFTIPLAFTGGLLALWITGKELSVIAMLGFLMLAGVVVNNGIVFVDYANGLRLEGMERAEALVQTGRDRIRPILMTAMTTIFGLATMALGLGAGGDMLQPLAIVTIGGLTYATLLTLFIVPAIYDIFLKKDPKKVVIEEVEEA